MKSLNLTHSVVAALLLAIPSVSQADDFVINAPVVTTNGGNTLNGDDTITVTSTGTVTTPAGEFGLTSTGNSNSLSNAGTITTQGATAYGINATGDSNTLSNSGTVVTTGTFGVGLNAAGDNNTATNTGSISTGGENGYGMSATGNSNTLSSTNMIATTGIAGLAIYVVGNTNTITHSGTATTTGENASGLGVAGDGNTINNSGSVTTTNDDAFGIAADGLANSVFNSGTLSTGGIESAGIAVNGDNGSVSNSGTILTTGEDAMGIAVNGDGVSVSNSGSVSVTGLDAIGIATMGDGIAVTVSGTVSSTQSYSVAMAGPNATLNLNAGSVLVGDIKFDTLASATLNIGVGMNAAIKTDNSIPMTINAPNGAFFVIGDTIYTVDSTGFASQNQSTGAMAGMIADTVSNQQNSGSGVTTRGITLSSKGHASNGWIKMFGGLRVDAGSATTSAFKSGAGGVVIGQELSAGNGFFFGTALGSSNSSLTSFSSTAGTLFGGLYATRQVMGLQADFSATIGTINNGNTRTIVNNAVPGGIETATSTSDSFFFSPSMTFRRETPVASGMLIPSFGLTLAAIQQGGYTETGSTSNLTVSSSVARTAKARLQIAHALTPRTVKKGVFAATIYTGIESQRTWGGAVTTSIAGTSIAFATGNLSSTKGFIGIKTNLLKSNGATISGGAEYGRDTSGSTTFDWNIKFNVSF